MHVLNLKITQHPILGNLFLDFTDCNGNPIDNIIFAGENGCGKTTILDILSNLGNVSSLPLNVTIEAFLKLNSLEQRTFKLQFGPMEDSKWGDLNYVNYKIIRLDNHSFHVHSTFYEDSKQQLQVGPRDVSMQFNCVYLTPEITFIPRQISSVTAKSTDSYSGGLIKSTSDIATTITQLLIDIDNQDNNDFCQLYTQRPAADYSLVQRKPRISRFNNAFSEIFDNMRIEKIENQDNQKKLLFKHHDNLVPVDKLSTGEKQIVFRGGFLLQNQQSTTGALVLIDEPEISLHPDWQKKISSFYKKIFTNDSGVQTSQIFMATHSPFIVHNNNRQNEKVIIFKRDTEGKIVVDTSPEYYSYDSKKVISKAFNCVFETPSIPTVFLEGRTDEAYFNKALEVYGFDNSILQFKWIGYIDSKGQEANTGKDALNKAYHFLYAQNTNHKCILLYDNDTQRQNLDNNNIYVRTIPFYQNQKGMKKGIENALILDDLDLTSFYNTKVSVGDYGEQKIISEFDKMSLCKHICSLPNTELEIILANVKLEIEKVFEILESN